MKFIEINSGISIRKDEIVAVIRNETVGCKVVTDNDSYESNFPYDTLIQILEIEQPQVNQRVDTSNMFGAQHWRG